MSVPSAVSVAGRLAITDVLHEPSYRRLWACAAGRIDVRDEPVKGTSR